ncbi:MAG: hypothetical protein MUE44_35125 [Oscillatoriaceae cyanobacterium Prado104]|nr:hypothetical protein [Oscillatoriaceae cyanobacterium Prado104]
MDSTHAKVSSTNGTGLRYYRSPSLISTSGEYAAYSRIELKIHPEFSRCRVSSVMFVENLRTGELQTVVAASPLAESGFYASDDTDMSGTIAIMVPVSWNQTGTRFLAREFEALFNSSDMSDYAVIWDRHDNYTYTVVPARSLYTHAVLLGWSQVCPGRVLFRAGNLGDRFWPLCAVDTAGQTVAVGEDKPLVFGTQASADWIEPQSRF